MPFPPRLRSQPARRGGTEAHLDVQVRSLRRRRSSLSHPAQADGRLAVTYAPSGAMAETLLLPVQPSQRPWGRVRGRRSIVPARRAGSNGRAPMREGLRVIEHRMRGRML